MMISKNNTLLKNILAACAILVVTYTGMSASAEEEQPKKFTHFTSGTGFFVGKHQIVTNDHVVQGCKYIKVRGAITPSYATVVARDEKNDLALLNTPGSPGRVAQLRGDNIPLAVGEGVKVMGYPLEHGIKGDYVVKQAKITDTNDIYQGIKRVQFTDSVEKGNSGGPLLDMNGNVIGVVVGKMSFYLADSDMGADAKPVKTSSMAISVNSLRNFLEESNVLYRTNNIDYGAEDKWMERKAKQFIVNVHCIKD